MHPFHDNNDCIHGVPDVRPSDISRLTQSDDALQIILYRDGVTHTMGFGVLFLIAHVHQI
jgi:hypothetical protein